MQQKEHTVTDWTLVLLTQHISYESTLQGLIAGNRQKGSQWSIDLAYMLHGTRHMGLCCMFVQNEGT